MFDGLFELGDDNVDGLCVLEQWYCYIGVNVYLFENDVIGKQVGDLVVIDGGVYLQYFFVWGCGDGVVEIFGWFLVGYYMQGVYVVMGDIGLIDIEVVCVKQFCCVFDEGLQEVLVIFV